MTSRVFEHIFFDATEHNNGLHRVATNVWWDGRLLLVEHHVSNRMRPEQEYFELLRDARVFQPVGHHLRRAIDLHDAYAREVFAKLEAQ